MSLYGGIFKVYNSQWSNPLTPDSKYYDCKAWGIVISEPEEGAPKKSPDSPYVSFVIKVRRKLNIQCFAHKKDNPYGFDISRRLRPGDMVDISGILREMITTITKGKNAGKERIDRQMTIHTIVPQRMVMALMEQADLATAPDTIEGLDVYLSQTRERGEKTNFANDEEVYSREENSQEEAL